MAAEKSGTMERKFGDPDFQAYFSRFYSEFSALYAEFQGKSTVYGDFWQFVLAKAAREMGILAPGEDRRLTDSEVRDLYNHVLAAMPKQDQLAPAEEPETQLEAPIPMPPPMARNGGPGNVPKPDWFTVNLPEEKPKP
ncbi:MAG: hypothetical protein WCP58_04285 [bacterium]